MTAATGSRNRHGKILSGDRGRTELRGMATSRIEPRRFFERSRKLEGGVPHGCAKLTVFARRCRNGKYLPKKRQTSDEAVERRREIPGAIHVPAGSPGWMSRTLGETT